MPTLFELLRQSHEIQRTLCRQVASARSDMAKRQLLFLQLKVELKAHAAAEERFLYVPLLMTDAGLSASRHALSEHHEIEELCEKLSVAHKSGASWLESAKELQRKVRHHLKEEESKFFKVAGRILGDAHKRSLAGHYQNNLIDMRKKYADEFATLRVARSGEVAPALEVSGTASAEA
jgi:hypothetical protein